MALSPWEVVLLFAPSAYEWCKFLDSSSGPQPNETWQDCPHHSGEKHHAQSSSWCKVRKLLSTGSGASSMRTGPVHVQGWSTTRNFCTLWLRIMTQVEEPHSLQGSEKFEAYPIHLSQQSLVDGHGTPSIKLQDISSTPHKTHGIVTMEAYAVPCTVSLWVVWILGLIKWASAERDLTKIVLIIQVFKVALCEDLGYSQELDFLS